MANALYPLGATWIMSAGIDLTTVDVRVALIDLGVYTYSDAHNDHADLSGIIADDGGALGSPTVVSGVYDANDITYTAVSGATAEALVIYDWSTASSATARLLLFIDTGVTGLPVTPNTGDIIVTWNGSGIFEFVL